MAFSGLLSINSLSCIDFPLPQFKLLSRPLKIPCTFYLPGPAVTPGYKLTVKVLEP